MPSTPPIYMSKTPKLKRTEVFLHLFPVLCIPFWLSCISWHQVWPIRFQIRAYATSGHPSCCTPALVPGLEILPNILFFVSPDTNFIPYNLECQFYFVSQGDNIQLQTISCGSPVWDRNCICLGPNPQTPARKTILWKCHIADSIQCD